MVQEVVVRDYELVRAEERAKIQTAAFENPVSEAPRSGGVYVVNGEKVDANGEPIEAQKAETVSDGKQDEASSKASKAKGS